MKKNEGARPAESLEESLELLFGRESDLAGEELDQELEAFGIDATKLQGDVHQRYLAYANHHYRTLDRPVPDKLDRALRALRPPTAAEKAQSVVRSAEELVDSFLNRAKSKSLDFLGEPMPARAQQPQFAFRNKKELSATDKALLQSEQEDLDSSDE